MVIAEHLSTWEVTEAQIPIMNYIYRTLAPDTATRVPEELTNCVELVRSRYRFEDIGQLRTRHFGFSGRPKPSILSDAIDVQRINFNTLNPTSINRYATLTAASSRIVNSLRLTSPLLVSQGDSVEVHVEYETDWVKRPRPKRVQEGD
jgi:hypothetical protein